MKHKNKTFVVLISSILNAQTQEDTLWTLQKEFQEIKLEINQLTNSPKEDLGRNELGRIQLEKAKINFEKKRHFHSPRGCQDRSDSHSQGDHDNRLFILRFTAPNQRGNGF